MRLGSRFDSHVSVLFIALMALSPFVIGGCGGGSSNPPAPPPPLAVAASPAGGNYAGAQDVALTATGNGAGSAIIYYTTDLSVPTNTSLVYSGPINISSETVLKFFAEPASGTPTDASTEGYTFAAGGIPLEWTMSGHGDIAAEAWRHWDEDGSVQTSCAKCHSADGFKQWGLLNTVSVPAALSMGLECSGCHTTIPDTMYDEVATYVALDHVEFPSGETVTLAGQSNLCIACHQGRASKLTVDTATPNSEVQTPDYDSYGFINIHYYAAAASYFGTEVLGGYEYMGQPYQARNTFGSHPDSLSTCTGCHMQEAANNHTWTPDLARCQECHTGADFTTLSGSPGTNHAAIQTALPELYAAIQAYATTLGYPVFYDSHAYPYWFNDPGDASYGNRYLNFDKTLLQAAYNYQFGLKEPGGYVHNGIYMRQLLHDSIGDLGAVPTDIPPDRAGYVEPANMFVAKTNQWRLSGHGHGSAEAFRHWDEDPAPQVVSSSCARCHTSPGFADWALDGTVTVTPSPVSTVGCIACHDEADLYSNDDTRWDNMSNVALRPVLFPSLATADLMGSSNVCMGCHQGRSSGVDVQATVDADMGVGPYTFINIHYFAAAAVFFGEDVEGGYQYRGMGAYRGQNPYASHGGSKNNCVDCHLRGSAADHSFLPQLTDCGPCHGSPPAGWKDQFGGTPGSNYTEIQSLLTDLYAAIQNHAAVTIGMPIFYDPVAYPYFFNDPGLAIYPNRYVNFDARLLEAAYNYQVGQKEPAAYMHNGIYMRQILYDALDDLDNGAQDNSVMGHSRP